MMIEPPSLSSRDEHIARLGDVGFWGRHVIEIVKRHDLFDSRHEPAAGFNATYPTFLYGDVVVKIFGCSAAWRQSHRAERAAHQLIASNPEIAAPRLLAEGQLSDDPHAPWPYLVTTRMHGVASSRADLSAVERQSVAVALGQQIRRIHALRPQEVATDSDWGGADVAAAAQNSSLPSHLAAQARDYVAALKPFDRVFTHGDVTASHVFVEDGRLSGIIDWGDAMATDRHYEIIQVYRDMLDCDAALLRSFLDAADWPVRADFPQRTLGLALYRQAIGRAQHHSMDVFEPIAARFPLNDIATLDELATTLFAL